MERSSFAALDGRSVFLTGHTGFKGAWLSLWLQRLGASVSGYALDPPTRPNLFTDARVRGALRSHHRGDVRDRAALSRALREAGPDIIIHLAAQALVRGGLKRPFETFDVNVMGTATLLEALRDLGRPCVLIVVTSDKCYRDTGPAGGCREDDPLGGADPYSASKGACEILVESYRSSFFSPQRLASHGIKLATVRAGNVIGGGDWAADRIVPDIVRALTSAQPVSLRNPSAVRPWQHVLEPLGGYLLLAARMLAAGDAEGCGSWNFGPTHESQRPVSDLVGRFIDAWGGGSWVSAAADARFNETQMLTLSIEKATDRLGWKPQWGFARAINRTARWYRKWVADPLAARDTCLEDIAAYELDLLRETAARSTCPVAPAAVESAKF